MFAPVRVGTRGVHLVPRRDVIESLSASDAQRVAHAVIELVGVQEVAAILGCSDTVEGIEDRLAKALEQGALVLVREPSPRRLDAPKSVPLSDLAERAAPIVPGRSFAVRIVDAYGAPLSGIDVALEHARGPEASTTDSGGCLRFENVRWNDVEASLEVDDVLRKQVVVAMQSCPGRAPLTRDDGVEVLHLRSRRLGPVRVPPDREVTISVQPFVALAKMSGMHFATDRDLPLASSIAMLPEVRRLYERCKPCDVLVVGHTDTTGTPEHNAALSLRRAQVVRALLTGDVDDWLARFESGWGKAEVQMLIEALPDSLERPAAAGLVEWFQSTRGLVADGEAGPVTRQALVHETMDRKGVRLPGGPEVIAHGCGEAFPLDATGVELDAAPVDGANDPMDRRVEVFLFDALLGIEPAPGGTTSAAGTTAYPAWRSSASETHEWVLGAEALELVLRDDEGNPVPKARVRVTLPGGVAIEAELDGDGAARLDRLPAGECRVELLDFPEGAQIERETGL